MASFGFDRFHVLNAFRALAADGLAVVDVGARGGTHPVLAEIASLVHLIGFEPDIEECHRLNAAPHAAFRSVQYLPYALGSEMGQKTLHLCRSAGASSLLRPHRRFLERFPDVERFDIVATRSVQTRTLDCVCVDSPLPAPIALMKVDAQGSELNILMGAQQALANVVAVEVEVEFTQLYESQPLFRDVDRYMAAQGFSLFKLRRMRWVRTVAASRAERTSGQMVFGDALYLRDPLASTAMATALGAWQAEALVLLACLYDCHDFALELLADAQIGQRIDSNSVRGYLNARLRRSGLNGLWKRRADRLGFFSWLHGYTRDWARGDLDFYSRV